MEFRNETTRFTIVTAGRRSRKTLLSKRRILKFALANPHVRLFHAAPTHRQAKSIFWNDLKHQTRFLRTVKSDSELFVRLKNDSEIHVLGLDKPERIEGQVWHGCHISEIANVKPGAWEEHIRPILSDTNGFAILDGVPEGLNFLYDLALYASDGALPETRPYDGAYAISQVDPEWCYYSWYSSDVLPDAEIEAARRHLDERTFRQEYQGSFESFKGLAYYAFSTANLGMNQYNPNRVIAIGMDFNVDPMTATLGHIEGDTYRQFGEVWMGNSNTYEMAEYLKERYPLRQCHIYPDATGRARESNATASDLAILTKAGFKVIANRSNPRVKDRLNAVNSALQHQRWTINPETCPKTISDLNRVERLPDGRLNKAQEAQQLGHISAAAGYLIAYNWPVTHDAIGYASRN